jgi:electron transport complex protein RnfG
MVDERVPSSPSATVDDSPGGTRMILAMGGIGLIAAVLIVMTYHATFPVIERNKAVALERAIFEVVPGATSKKTFARAGGELRALGAGEDAVETYYACYGEGGELVGVAVEASGQGFQDVIRVLYGYAPGRGCVVGMKVLESKETPGLGDKIMKDPRFRANFDALDARLGEDGSTLAHAIELAKKGEKTDAWQVEAITGATISSRAIASILRESTAVAVPLIRKNMGVLEGGVE